MIVNFKNYVCNIVKEKYANGRTALLLKEYDDNSPIATATVNLPKEELADDEVIIKSWSENEGMSITLQEVSVIGKVRRKIQTGHVTATVHKLLI